MAVRLAVLEQVCPAALAEGERLIQWPLLNAKLVGRTSTDENIKPIFPSRRIPLKS
ncbi:hypothetical protein P3T21_000052 [Paraburkholderia sp. GAS334]